MADRESMVGFMQASHMIGLTAQSKNSGGSGQIKNKRKKQDERFRGCYSNKDQGMSEIW